MKDDDEYGESKHFLLLLLYIALTEHQVSTPASEKA